MAYGLIGHAGPGCCCRSFAVPIILCLVWYHHILVVDRLSSFYSIYCVHHNPSFRFSPTPRMMGFCTTRPYLEVAPFCTCNFADWLTRMDENPRIDTRWSGNSHILFNSFSILFCFYWLMTRFVFKFSQTSADKWSLGAQTSSYLLGYSYQCRHRDKLSATCVVCCVRERIPGTHARCPSHIHLDQWYLAKYAAISSSWMLLVNLQIVSQRTTSQCQNISSTYLHPY